MAAAGNRDRERSHWGWGYADRSPDRATLEALAPELRRRLGFGGDRIEEPVPLEAVEIAPPRLQPPESLAPILSDAPADRLRHSVGRAYRDVVRGFRGRFERTPDLVAFPQDEEDVRRVLELCAERRLAAIPFGGGTSVVGGVEPRIGRGYRGTVAIALGGLFLVFVQHLTRAGWSVAVRRPAEALMSNLLWPCAFPIMPRTNGSSEWSVA